MAPKRTRLTGPASYKKAKLSNGVGSSSGTYQVRSTVPSSYRRRVEVKQIALNSVGITPNVSGYIADICINVPLGDDYNQREGRTIKLLDAQWGLQWQVPVASAPSAEFALRAIVFVWNQELFPSVGDILQTGNIISEYNIQQVPKYRILSDRVYNHSTSLATQNMDNIIIGKCKINTLQEYPGGATPDALKGKVHLLLICNNSPQTITLRAACRYIDV